MSSINKIAFIIFLIVAFIFGLSIGILWQDLPLVKFNPELKLFEVANFFLTLIIGISIPLLVKKWIEDNRSVKSSLVEEIKDVVSTLDKIKSLITKCHQDSSITKKDKDDINYLFHQTELKINSLDEQLKVSFSKQSKEIIDGYKIKYHTYKDFLTGGELMLSSFSKVEDRFYREHNTEYSKIETHLKTVIHKIYKL